MNKKKLQVFKNLTMEALNEAEMVSPGYLSLLLCANTDMCLPSSEAKEVLESLKKEDRLVMDDTGQFYGKPPSTK